MAKKRKRKYSRGAGTEVKREMHRYKRGKAKSGKGGKGGKGHHGGKGGTDGKAHNGAHWAQHGGRNHRLAYRT